MARLSQVYWPNPDTGVKELHHHETELSQVEDIVRQPSTAYSVDDIKFSSLLPTGYFLACTVAGTSDSDALVVPASVAEGDTITDGTVTWEVKKQAGLAEVTKLIGYVKRERTTFTLSGLEAAVVSGNYAAYGIEPGDYYTGTSGYTYIFAGHNPLKGTSEYTITSDHAGLIVDTHATSKWNSSNDTTGGYVSSTLHSYLVNTVLPNVKTDLGGVSHLYAHKKLYSSTMTSTRYNRYGNNTGASSAWAWSDSQYISALTEMQVYGGTVWSSSGYDTGEANQQLEVFKHFKHTEIFGSEAIWLRDVSSSSSAARANAYGNAGNTSASGAMYVSGLIAFH